MELVASAMFVNEAEMSANEVANEVAAEMVSNEVATEMVEAEMVEAEMVVFFHHHLQV